MKLQGLAIIFVIIILPITIIIGEYARVQMQTFKLEQLYDTRLITATDDALDAFQINTFNDATSDIADSKIDSIEASANAFLNSMESNFGLDGYSKEELLNYVPALVYTMYDGYYIYSPYTNVANISDGTVKLDGDEIDYGFKPYVYYSCRYVRGNIDVIITYSLDNYITVQGTIDGEGVCKSGYLLTIDTSAFGTKKGVWQGIKDGKIIYHYNGIEISSETKLEDKLIEKDGTSGDYAYIKLNGTKYYWDETSKEIFYLMGGNRIKQVTEVTNKTVYDQYVSQIETNTSAINYYKDAYDFSEWVNDELGRLTIGDAQDELLLSGNKTDKIFENIILNSNTEKCIEYSGSNFNLHRREVIRHSIESNLSVAIANFNTYTNSGNNFQMPKLKDDEWELLENEVSIISFLQGVNIGGKLYNGYTVVANTKTEEVVKEENIYLTTKGEESEGYYHKINDSHLEDDDYAGTVDTGVLNLDFEIRKDGATGIAYTQKDSLGCYTSIVGQNKVVTGYDSVYEYLDNSGISDEVKEIYYTALARERWGNYKVENSTSINKILTEMKDSSAVPGDGGTEPEQPQDPEYPEEPEQPEQPDQPEEVQYPFEVIIKVDENQYNGEDIKVRLSVGSYIGYVSEYKGSHVQDTEWIIDEVRIKDEYAEDGEVKIDCNKSGIVGNGNIIEVNLYTMTVSVNNSGLGMISRTSELTEKLSLLVLDNTAYSTNENEFILNDGTGRKITATPKETDEWNRNILFKEWSSSTGTITSQTTITAEFKKYSIITDGIIRNYEAHKDLYGEVSQMVDLTGNSTISLQGGAQIQDDCKVVLNGTDSWINLGQVSQDYRDTNEITLEATVEFNELKSSGEAVIIANYDSGGAGISVFDGKRVEFQLFIEENKENWYSKAIYTFEEGLDKNHIYKFTATYDGTEMKLYIDGECKATTTVSGIIKVPENNTVMAIGANPTGSSVNAGYANINVYSAKVYNMALTEGRVVSNSRSIDGLIRNYSIIRTWTDIAKNFDGIMAGGITVGNKFLQFESEDDYDWINIGYINSKQTGNNKITNQITMEASIKLDAIQEGEVVVMANYESSGVGISIFDGHITFQVRKR